MQANPRARVAANWAPPPAVTGQAQSTPPPAPNAPAVRSKEAEFEATLGSLVDYYSSLPPVEYGEPPAVSADVTERTSFSRGYFWWGLCSLVMGAALAGGALAIVHITNRRPIALNHRREVPISIKAQSTKAATPAVELATEPLDEAVAPETSALPDETHNVVEFAKTSANAASATKQTMPATTKRAHRTAPEKRPAVRAASVKRASEDESWEDPYR